ncbi:hypothetical protein M409DRAFT_59605 [Zasmidium cellare ATCC 36951]|uniref:Uncharacterized protein n=1 Tax=Zasmidium cellare ATCC 36951 TaxID=1080233 RepID=A0A6A6C1B2_ZASCE|nr:uncharacterized protein M409DRAFT_59605 [Zasmidium cellare ATCC 36951]KAF2160811.1 hypothetical protein M409DRAFT_59605 [Zasmidium cellare ATCC 36951]
MCGGGGVGDGGGSGGDCCCSGLTQVWLGCEGRWREGTTQWLDRLLQHPSPDSLQSPLPFKMLINLPTLSRRFDLTKSKNNNDNNHGSIEGGRRVAEGGQSLENSRAKRAHTKHEAAKGQLKRSKLNPVPPHSHSATYYQPTKTPQAVRRCLSPALSRGKLGATQSPAQWPGQATQHHLLLLVAPVLPLQP